MFLDLLIYYQSLSMCHKKLLFFLINKILNNMVCCTLSYSTIKCQDTSKKVKDGKYVLETCTQQSGRCPWEPGESVCVGFEL